MTACAAGTTALTVRRRRNWILAVAIGVAVAIAAATMALRGGVHPVADAPAALAGIGGDFELAGGAGSRVRLADYRGRLVILFFGYTHCPDVCPTTLLALRQAMDGLGGAAAQVQVIMVSVDPRRDPPDALASYVHFFDARFVGLSGTSEEVDRVARQYKVFYRQGDAGGGASYSVAHSGYLYALDRQGRVRTLLGAGAKPAEIGAALQQLLGEPADTAS